MLQFPRPTSAHPAVAVLPAIRVARLQHDLRTPLTVAQGHVQLLHGRLARLVELTGGDRAQLLGSADAIERACRELSAVIDRLVPPGDDASE